MNRLLREEKQEGGDLLVAGGDSKCWWLLSGEKMQQLLRCFIANCNLLI